MAECQVPTRLTLCCLSLSLHHLSLPTPNNLWTCCPVSIFLLGLAFVLFYLLFQMASFKQHIRSPTEHTGTEWLVLCIICNLKFIQYINLVFTVLQMLRRLMSWPGLIDGQWVTCVMSNNMLFVCSWLAANIHVSLFWLLSSALTSSLFCWWNSINLPVMFIWIIQSRYNPSSHLCSSECRLSIAETFKELLYF